MPEQDVLTVQASGIVELAPDVADLVIGLRMEEPTAIVRELVDAGANQIQGLRFSLADPQPYVDQAHRQAVQDARRRATILADAAGRRLGPVVTLAETTWNDPGVVTMARAAAPRGDVPVESGQIGVRAGVSVKWRLEP